MSSRYIGRNINVFLVIILIVSILSLVAISTYYSKRYEMIGNNNRNVSFELRKTQAELIAAKNELTDIKSKFNQTSVDVQKYDEIYKEKESQLQTTQADLQRTSASYETVKKDLVEKTSQLKESQAKASQCEADLKVAEDNYNLYKTRYNSCSADLEDCSDFCPAWS
jgi:chromosome segregation ATPase